MFPILGTAGMVLTLEDYFCWDLQALFQALFFAWAYTEIWLVSLPPHVFIADFRLYVILLASDDIVGCSVCHRMHIPKNVAIASALIAGWAAARLCLPAISSYALSGQETLNPPVLGRKCATLPLLGGTLSFSPPNIGCGFLARPNLFSRLCNFVLFGARTRWF